MVKARPQISIVIATHNRRVVACESLARLQAFRKACEIIVVDNASADGSADAVAPLCDRVIRLTRNRGSCAKAYGVDESTGAYVVFLDDDSCPDSDSLERMVEHFADDAKLGAAGFTVTLPDDRREGSALPDVFVGCGVGFRREALQTAGGLDRTFFMQAEEYDLAFRLASAGWRVAVFDDLHVEHRKTPAARRSERTTYYDIRNNLRVLARYVPREYYRGYREDCVQRYRWLAESAGHTTAFQRGLRSSAIRSVLERGAFRKLRLGPETFESFFRLREIETRMHQLDERGVRRIVLADWGKNVLAFYRGALRAGLDVAAVGDDRFAAPGRQYRGIPVIPLAEALSQHCDAVVVANTGPVHAEYTRRRLERETRLPIHDWFGCRTSEAGFVSLPPVPASDDMHVVAGA
jgi:hypothetical protein